MAIHQALTSTLILFSMGTALAAASWPYHWFLVAGRRSGVDMTSTPIRGVTVVIAAFDDVPEHIFEVQYTFLAQRRERRSYRDLAPQKQNPARSVYRYNAPIVPNSVQDQIDNRVR